MNSGLNVTSRQGLPTFLVQSLSKMYSECETFGPGSPTEKVIAWENYILPTTQEPQDKTQLVQQLPTFRAAPASGTRIAWRCRIKATPMDPLRSAQCSGGLEILSTQITCTQSKPSEIGYKVLGRAIYGGMELSISSHIRLWEEKSSSKDKSSGEEQVRREPTRKLEDIIAEKIKGDVVISTHTSIGAAQQAAFRLRKNEKFTKLLKITAHNTDVVAQLLPEPRKAPPKVRKYQRTSRRLRHEQ